MAMNLSGFTPLDVAVEAGHRRCVELLLGTELLRRPQQRLAVLKVGRGVDGSRVYTLRPGSRVYTLRHGSSALKSKPSLPPPPGPPPPLAPLRHGVPSRKRCPACWRPS